MRFANAYCLASPRLYSTGATGQPTQKALNSRGGQGAGSRNLGHVVLLSCEERDGTPVCSVLRLVAFSLNLHPSPICLVSTCLHIRAAKSDKAASPSSAPPVLFDTVTGSFGCRKKRGMVDEGAAILCTRTGRYLGKMFCKMFSESSIVLLHLPWCSGKQGELTENCFQNLLPK